MLYDPIKKFSNIHNKMQDAIAATERIDELFKTEPTIVSGPKVLTHIDRIRFDDVSLKYGDKTALEHINIDAVTTSGTIYVNDDDIRDYTLHSLHRKIAFVTQRIFIFQDTVANNVAYGEDVDEARVVRALDRAHAWEFVEALPEGIHTRLDEFGTNLRHLKRR